MHAQASSRISSALMDDLPQHNIHPHEHEQGIGQRGDDVEYVRFIIGEQDWSVGLVRIIGPLEQ
jgi:hypothetical protein